MACTKGYQYHEPTEGICFYCAPATINLDILWCVVAWHARHVG
jgi:hypothetical protein